MAEEFDPYRKWLGIPSQDQPPHHYRLLGIATFEDDPDVIENAATRQMTHVRTFQTGRHAALSQRLLTELAAAKLCLLVPEKKAAYDEQLQGRLAAAGQVATDLYVPTEPTEIRSPDSRWKVGPERFSPEPPPPVPLRIPAAVTAGSMPIVVKTNSHATHRLSHRQSVLPLAITAICLLVLTAGGIVAIVVGGRTLDGESGTAAKKPETAPLHTPFPVGSASSPEAAPPGDKASGAAVPGVSQSGASLPGAEQAPAAVPAVKVPQRGSSAMTADEQIRSQLWLARNALAARDDATFQKHFSEAEQLLSKHHPTSHGELLAEVAHLKQLKSHLDRFWTAVRESVKSARPGEKLEFDQRESIELLAKEGDRLKFELDGVEGEATIHDLPPHVAVAYALRDGRTKPELLIAAAAFLTIDNAGANEPGSHRAAKRLFREALDLGPRDPALAKELSIRSGGTLNLEATPSTIEPPAAPNGSTPTAAAAIRAARTKLAEAHREPLEAARSSADAASALIESFTAEAAQVTDPIARQALWEESLDLAIRWCLMDQLDTLCDSLAAARGSDPLEMKAYFIDRCAPTTSAQVGAIKAKIDALKQIADSQGKVETSLKFSALGVKAAIAQGILDFAERLKQ